MSVSSKIHAILLILLFKFVYNNTSLYSACTKRLEILFRHCLLSSLISKRCLGLNEGVISSSYSGIEELKKLCNSCRGCEVSFMSCSVNKLDSIDNRECSQAKMYSNTFRRKLAGK
ncbi:unnamed protein product [Schistosoma rodhaini]|uniref:Secreted protein n=1 Tax=Schistosoma mansoni TaxID=6183 RepID=A0A5K4F4S7_SCHMA|nr:unnamed protein product [Schistosoma rodhaini]